MSHNADNLIFLKYHFNAWDERQNNLGKTIWVLTLKCCRFAIPVSGSKMFAGEGASGVCFQIRFKRNSFFFRFERDGSLNLPWLILAGVWTLAVVVRYKAGLQILSLSNIKVSACCAINQDIDVVKV